MTSLVAKANISAQETLCLHPGTLSTAALALITVSKPSPASERSSPESFSALPLGDANITEASHPYYVSSHMNVTCNEIDKLNCSHKTKISTNN